MTHGLCECGCGQRAPIARKTSRRDGHVKGEPVRFISGHHLQFVRRPGTPKPLLPRLLAAIDFTRSDCWEWCAAKSAGGYGRLSVDGVVQYAHRVIYALLVGPIPSGREIDHICRNRACVNPAHLEPVTHAENMRRAAAARR